MIVDAHAHVFPTEVSKNRATHAVGEPAFELLYAHPGSRMATATELLQAMDTDGVATSIVCGFPWLDTGRARMHNTYILEACRQHPGRLVPLAAVDPLAAGAGAEAERALSAGAAGLGEIGVYTRDLGEPQVASALAALARLCAEADRPLLLHTNEPVGHAYPGKSPMGLRGLYDLIRTCEQTRFQLAHLGGGIFFFELLRREVQKTLAACVFDTAAAPYLYRPELYPVFTRLAGTDRLLYGSDFPLLGLGRYLRDLDKAGIDPQGREAILQHNARRFWNLG